MAERFKAPVLKTDVGVSSPRVRISLPPPVSAPRCGAHSCVWREVSVQVQQGPAEPGDCAKRGSSRSRSWIPGWATKNGDRLVAYAEQ